MHHPAFTWTQPATLHIRPGASGPGAVALTRIGTLADLIRWAMETLPPPERRHMRIEYGDTYLGPEAIALAYRRYDFPPSWPPCRGRVCEYPVDQALLAARYFSSQWMS